MDLHALPRPQSLREQRYHLSPIAAFDRVSWIVLAFALLLVIGSVMQKAYRLSLPTDGWAFTGGTVGGPDQDRPIFTAHLLDESSPLHVGDRLLAVQGRSFERLIADAHSLHVDPL